MDAEAESEMKDLETLASLAEPVRRMLYEYVVSAHQPVSRDEAAEAVDVSRQVAAYHLDRLAEGVGIRVPATHRQRGAWCGPTGEAVSTLRDEL